MSHQESTRYRSNSHALPELTTTVAQANSPNTRGGPTERSRKIWILEGVYTSDTRRLEKVREKHLQHEGLMKALELRDYQAQLMAFVFGFGGTIFDQTMTDLGEIGVESTACKATLKEVHLHSIEVPERIIVQRTVKSFLVS